MRDDTTPVPTTRRTPIDPHLERLFDSVDAMAHSLTDLHTLVGRIDERSSSAILQIGDTLRRHSARAKEIEEDAEQRAILMGLASEKRDEAIAAMLKDRDARFDQLQEVVRKLVDRDLERKAQWRGIVLASSGIGSGITVAIGAIWKLLGG